MAYQLTSWSVFALAAIKLVKHMQSVQNSVNHGKTHTHTLHSPWHLFELTKKSKLFYIHQLLNVRRLVKIIIKTFLDYNQMQHVLYSQGSRRECTSDNNSFQMQQAIYYINKTYQCTYSLISWILSSRGKVTLFKSSEWPSLLHHTHKHEEL